MSRKRQVTIERHSHTTKHVLDSPLGPVAIEIETSTTIFVTLNRDDEEELFEYCPFEEEPPAPKLPRITRRPR
jgi:hypothetical protein